MSTDEDDLTLRLLLKGLDPGQAQAIAQDAGNQFAGAMQGVNAKLLELHEQQGKLLLASDIKYSQQRIDEEIRKGQVVQKLIDEQTRAEEKAIKDRERADKEHLDVSLANLAHLGEVIKNTYEMAKIGFESIVGTFEGIKAFAEHVNQVSIAYGALKGSVSEASDALHGQVTELDLIQVRNRATAKDLNLTDEEFKNLASTAQHFAEITGTDVKSALDGLVDGLATGRLRTLAHAGVIIDATKAQEAYAKAHHETIDELTSEDKLHAIQIAALEKMKDRTHELGVETMTVAQGIVAAWNSVTNAVNRSLVALGHLRIETDDMEYGRSANERNEDAIRRKRERGEAADAMLAGAHGDLGEGGQDVTGQWGTSLEERERRETLSEGSGKGAKRDASAARAAAAKAKKDREFLDELLFGASGKGRYQGGGDTGLDALMTGATSGDTGQTEAIAKASEQQQKLIEKLVSDQEKRLGAAGIKKGGLMARIMFGDPVDANGDPSEDFANKVRGTSDVVLELMADMTAASHQMAQAAGASIEAAIGGASSASLRKMVHDQLLALGTKYQVRALEFGAEAAGYAVFGDAPQAALALEAAGLWEVAAVAAGVGARAVGTGGGGGASGRASTSSPPIQRGSGLPSSTQGSGGSNNGGQPQTIIINQTILPGGEAEAGMRVRQALKADYLKTGEMAYPGSQN